MHDQAAQLRNLVFRSVRQPKAEGKERPRTIAVCGGRSQVGTTMLATNLAVALATNGSRTVLVDADQHDNGVSKQTGIVDSRNDWTLDKSDIHEVLQRGPAGIQVAAPLWDESTLLATKQKILELLKKQLCKLFRHTDVVVLDAGNQPGDLLTNIWDLADEVILVTTPDPIAVMDAYTLTKGVVTRNVHTPTAMVVNRVTSDQLAFDVQARLQKSCERFFKHKLSAYGHIAEDARVDEAIAESTPIVQRWPARPSVQQIHRLAEQLIHEESALKTDRARVA